MIFSIFILGLSLHGTHALICAANHIDDFSALNEGKRWERVHLDLDQNPA